ncbi:DUF1345 domain-containing protein [Micromonospora phytophila]|uniref:DUF1345 domain-containing protein n=1 Tax=Micromonospora phytophila TaxID=709888 RepID=UPI00202FBFE1|nr:DUF1345 domain-containing protein [Micromonospora phytophila]MCM0673610.1 DUF1345 domain-containing protein [Micromonospora phytophila]
MEQRSGRPALGRLLSVRRALWSLAVGVVAGTATALLGAPELTPLVIWTIAAGTVLVWAWRACWSASPQRTEQLAEAERHSRSTDSALLIASVISLAAVAEALVRASNEQDMVAVTLVILSVVAVVLAWALVNTVFAFKYARLYYRDDDGGVDFKREGPPAYADFAYVAFTVGMSYAPGENEPTSNRMRRIALGHALLSYAFGTGILAVAINLVTNLGQS